jgi:hypothetical protein
VADQAARAIALTRARLERQAAELTAAGAPPGGVAYREAS